MDQSFILESVAVYFQDGVRPARYSIKELEADKMLIRFASVCKGWKNTLSREHQKATIRLGVYLLNQFPRQLSSMLTLRLPQVTIDNRGNRALNIRYSPIGQMMRQSVVRYCIYENDYPEGLRGVALKIRAIRFPWIEAVLFVFQPVGGYSFSHIDCRWQGNNRAIQELYHLRHIGNVLENHTGHLPGRPLPNGRSLFCERCPFIFQKVFYPSVHPKVLTALLKGQDPNFTL